MDSRLLACAFALTLACAAPRPAPSAPSAPGAGAPGTPPAGAVGRTYARVQAPAAAAAARRGSAQRALALDPSCGLGNAPRSLSPSSACTVCHDGSSADDRLPTRGHHPIDADYEAARLRGRKLRPSSEVRAEIVLVNGRQVACTSCHAASSAEPHHLSVTMRGSALCLGCHPRD